MKFNKFTTTLILIIAILIAVLIISSGNDTEIDKYAKQKQDIDSLSNLITNLEKQQLKYDSLLVCYKDSLLKKDLQIDSTIQEIKQIQNHYGKKIKIISTASHAELSNFFTDRYK